MAQNRFRGVILRVVAENQSGTQQAEAGTRLSDASSARATTLASHDASWASELPLEVKKAAVAGIGTAALVWAGVAASYLVMLLATYGPAQATPPASTYFGSLVPILLLDLAMFGVTRLPRSEPDVVIRLGYVHFAVVALLLALLRHSHPWPDGEAIRQWSPVAVWIIVFGALVPARPGVMLGWSLFAATMDPLALLVARNRLAPVSLSEGLVLEFSPFLAAVIAYVTSSALYGLNERIAKAREFGSYRLVKRLGTGGMAEVWSADHSMLARPAAVKLIRPSVLRAYGEKEAQRLVRLFEREVQATAELRSPHAIEVYDFGVSRDGTFYYVMELLDGFDLQTLVERFGKQPAERVVHVLRQVCHSLHEAHTKGLVHRDMKPGNIYVCRYGADLDFAKVLDFGLVLDRRPTAEELDEVRGYIGTPAIMSPEQMRFGAPVDQRTDIYALGCVAYWLLTGVRVFEAQTRNDMLVMHAHQKPVTPSARARIDVPPELETLVMDCLSKNPDRRPQSAMELARRLDETGLANAWTPERMATWWQDPESSAVK